MNHPIAQRIRTCPPSATIKISDWVKARRRAGADIVDLAAARAAEGTPEHICRAAAEAIVGGDTHQSMARGSPEFRAACARKLQRDNGIEADPEAEIIATFGCKHGLMLALLATVNPGEEVILEDPGFVSYAPAIQIAGAVPVPIPVRAEDGFRWREDSLRAAVTRRTRAILLCSPHNPTGIVHGIDDLDRIASLAQAHDLYIISDEIYERAVWGGRAHTSVATRPGASGRSITLMGLTKTASMGGWRIGFAYAPPPVIEAMTVLQQHMTTGVTTFGQVGGAAVFGHPPDASLQEMWREWEARCADTAAQLDALPNVSCAPPEGGFYAWANVSETGEQSDDLAQRLLRDHAAAVVPGTAFGAQGEGYIRVTCVKSWDELKEGLRRLKEALA